jgi:hypothetical protein
MLRISRPLDRRFPATTSIRRKVALDMEKNFQEEEQKIVDMEREIEK